MSLTNCSECQSEVSSNAMVCPKCGNPIASLRLAQRGTPKRTGLGRKIARVAGTIAVGFIALVIWVAYESSPDRTGSVTSTDGSVSSATHTPPAPPIAISADDLYAAYKANEVAADAKYKGKTLEVTGVVGSISKDVMDDPYITLVTTENEFETVNAYFSKGAMQKLSELRKGQGVTVTCRGNGMVLTSPMLDCK
jgi:hypothetical protein